MAKVEVHPVPTEKWHGKSPSEIESSPYRLSAYFDSTKAKYLVDMPDAELKSLETQLGAVLSTAPAPGGKPHPFYDNVRTGMVVLQNNDVVSFDTDIAADRVRIAILRAHPEVGNTLDEAKENGCLFYIYDPHQDTKMKANRITRQRTVRTYIAGLSLDQRRNYALAVLKTPVDGLSEMDLTVKEEEIVNEHLLEAERVKAETIEFVHLMATVERAVERGNLRKMSSGYFHGNERIGETLPQAANWLKSPRQADILTTFLAFTSSEPALADEVRTPDDAGVQTPDE